MNPGRGVLPPWAGAEPFATGPVPVEPFPAPLVLPPPPPPPFAAVLGADIAAVGAILFSIWLDGETFDNDLRPLSLDRTFPWPSAPPNPP
jgi:hypothetical protein